MLGTQQTCSGGVTRYGSGEENIHQYFITSGTAEEEALRFPTTMPSSAAGPRWRSASTPASRQ
ncbi:hypothetical protein QJS66_19700 [Kocuria rhizophila]|nr:hypothetical protein QJS66_19700 [Kocuria rhizophila]